MPWGAGAYARGAGGYPAQTRKLAGSGHSPRRYLCAEPRTERHNPKPRVQHPEASQFMRSTSVRGPVLTIKNHQVCEGALRSRPNVVKQWTGFPDAPRSMAANARVVDVARVPRGAAGAALRAVPP